VNKRDYLLEASPVIYRDLVVLCKIEDAGENCVLCGCFGWDVGFTFEELNRPSMRRWKERLTEAYSHYHLTNGREKTAGRVEPSFTLEHLPRTLVFLIALQYKSGITATKSFDHDTFVLEAMHRA
jgi:hypothetical protein